MKRNLSWPALILSTLTIISCVPYNPAPPANGQSYYTAPQRNLNHTWKTSGNGIESLGSSRPWARHRHLSTSSL